MAVVSSRADRSLKLLDPERHSQLLRRLQAMDFLFQVDLSLDTQDVDFVQDFNAKVLDRLTVAGVTLPSKLPEQRSLDLPESGTTPLSMHSLDFRLLQVSSKRVGAKFSVTTEPGPFNFEKLSKAPFGPRITNSLTPKRNLLFIGRPLTSLRDVSLTRNPAPSYGLPIIRRSIDPSLRQTLRLPEITGDNPLETPPLAHVCIGLRLLNGFVNDARPTDEAWTCLPECEISDAYTSPSPRRVSHRCYSLNDADRLYVLLSQLFVDTDSDEDEDSHLFAHLIEPPTVSRRLIPSLDTYRPPTVHHSDSIPEQRNRTHTLDSLDTSHPPTVRRNGVAITENDRVHARNATDTSHPPTVRRNGVAITENDRVNARNATDSPSISPRDYRRSPSVIELSDSPSPPPGNSTALDTEFSPHVRSLSPL